MWRKNVSVALPKLVFTFPRKWLAQWPCTLPRIPSLTAFNNPFCRFEMKGNEGSAIPSMDLSSISTNQDQFSPFSIGAIVYARIIIEEFSSWTVARKICVGYFLFFVWHASRQTIGWQYLNASQVVDGHMKHLLKTLLPSMADQSTMHLGSTSFNLSNNEGMRWKLSRCPPKYQSLTNSRARQSCL